MGHNIFIHFPVKDIDFSVFVWGFCMTNSIAKSIPGACSLVLQGECFQGECLLG